MYQTQEKGFLRILTAVNTRNNAEKNFFQQFLLEQQLDTMKTSNLEVGLADRETETKRGKKTKTEKQRHKNTKIRNSCHYWQNISGLNFWPKWP